MEGARHIVTAVSFSFQTSYLMRASKPHIRVHTQLRIYFGEPIAVVGQIEVMLGIHEVQLSSQATGSKCIVKGEAPIVFGPNCLSNFV